MTLKIHSYLFLLLTFCLISAASMAFVNYDEWEGDVDSDWNNANNWEGNSLPTSTQAARVGNSAFTFAPVISSNSTFTPRYVVVQGGDTLTIGADLSSDRDFFIGQGSKMIINAGDVSTGTNRDLNIRNEDTKVIVNGGTLTITDDLYLDRLLDIVPGADPTLEVNGGKVFIGGDMRFDGIFAEKPTLEVQGGTVDITGSLYNDGADVTVTISSDSLIIRGDIDMNGSADSLLMTGGVLYLPNDAGTFTNDGIITCTGGEVVFAEDYTLDGSGTTQFHDLTIESGTGAVDQVIAQIDINGDITNNGTYTPNTNAVRFNGSTAQTISGSSALNLYDLTINNSNDVQLSTDLSILAGGTFTFTNGVLHSDTTNTLTFSDGATSTGQSSTSYVDNYIRKVGDDDFIFPLGEAGILMELGISNATSSAVSDVFEASYNRGTHPQAFWDSLSYGGNPGGMYNVSILDNWKLYRTNGSAQPFVRLYWSDGDSSQINDLTDLVVAHYTGSSTWENLGGTTSGTVASGYVETSARVNNFSPFTFGSSSSTANPLPITLGDFNVNAMGDVVQINWNTLSEINNDYFEIERSLDAQNFEGITKIEGAGNSSSELEYNYIDNNPITNRYSYYRLKQTDFNGEFSYSSIQAIFVGKNEVKDIIVFPNPVLNDEVFVNMPDIKNETVKALIFDQIGNRISESDILVEGDNVMSVKVPEKNGLYLLKIVTTRNTYTKRITVE